MRKLTINLLSLTLLLATSLFASFSYAEGTVSPQIKYRATTSNSSCTGIRTADHPSYLTTRDAACNYQTSGATSDGSNPLGTCNGYPRDRCFNGGSFTAYNTVVPICPANSTVSGSLCACNTGYGPSNGQCVQGQTLTPQEQCSSDGNYWIAATSTCHSSNPCNQIETYNATTYSCDVNSTCTDQNNQLLDYLATDNAEVDNPVLHPTSDYIDLCYNGCKYQNTLNAQSLRCYVLQGDSQPRKGYCEQEYAPTHLDCEVGLTNDLGYTPPAPVTNCQVNHTKNDFDVCVPDDISCGTWQELDSNNVCQDIACPTGYSRQGQGLDCVLDTVSGISCGINQHTIDGQHCLDDRCPDGMYRTATGNDCIQLPDNTVEATCPETLDTQSTCMKNSPYKIVKTPNSQTCTAVQSFVDPQLNIKCNSNPPTDFQISQLPINCTLPENDPNSWYCQNQQLYFDGYTPYTGADPSPPPLTAQLTGVASCPNNSAMDSNGFCQSDVCINNPDLPECNNETSSDSSGDCEDEPEKCEKLQDIYDLLEGTKAPTELDADLTSFDTELDDAMGDYGVDENGTYNNPVTSGLLDNFRNSDVVTTLYDNYKLINPSVVFLSQQSDCTLMTTYDGRQVPISICDIQDELHSIISFILAVMLYFGIRGLMEERPA